MSTRLLRRRGSKIVKAVQPFVDNHSLAGAVMLAATKDKVLEVATVGFADVANQAPMRTDSLFWIASMTKPITGAALMILVDEGRVNVDDRVEKYLPGFKGQKVIAEQDELHTLLKKPAHPITVRNVLSHTSGLPFCSPVEAPHFDVLPLKQCVLSYTMQALLFEPDTKYQYSNAGTNTAGHIIEVVTGQTYEQFLSERLLEPLGMTDTTFRPTTAQLKRLAKAYKPNEAKTDLEETKIDQMRYPLNDPTRHGFPAGGLFSTAHDVARFCQMVLNRGELEGRRYLSEAAIAEMTRRQTLPQIPESYGFCWSTGEDWCGHGGALATNMMIRWKQDLITVYLVQHAGFPGEGGKARDAFDKAAWTLRESEK